MSQLLPCSSCSRHVRRTESACPFCGTSIAFAGASSARTSTERLGRAAIFTFGAVIATTAGACTGNTVPAYGAPAVDAATADTGGAVPLYGAPSDAGYDAAITTDAGQPGTLYGGPVFDDANVADHDAGGSSADYGGPPP